MRLYRRGKDGRNEAVHKSHYHGGSVCRPGEVKAYPVGKLPKGRNAKNLRMPGSYVGNPPRPQEIEQEKRSGGKGCTIFLIFIGLSTSTIGTIIYNIAQYLS